MIPLIFAKENVKLKICDIKGRGNDTRKLIEKGFCVGVDIILTRIGDKFIVKIDNTKYMIDFRLAQKIIIEE